MNRIIHIIPCLDFGGTEMILYKLLMGLNPAQIQTQVISLTDIGLLGKKIQSSGIPVKALHVKKNPFALLSLSYWLKRFNPHLVHTWLYPANLVGGIVAKLITRAPVIWSICQGNLDPLVNTRRNLWLAKICAHLSQRVPSDIVFDSECAHQVHCNSGYAIDKGLCIPTGVDLDVFRSDSTIRSAIRNELKVRQDVILIGLIARFDPHKDHENFVRAASGLSLRFPNVQFLLCGKNITWKNNQLVRWIRDGKIENQCHLLGQREDVNRIMAALDIATLSSVAESLPTVIIEAMACEISCVVTDVGMSAQLVGDTGKVVPARNSHALAVAWDQLINAGHESRSQMGKKARQRIQEHFTLSSMIDRYRRLYSETMEKQ